MRKLRNIVLLLLCPGAVVVAAVLSQFSFRQGDFRSVGTSGVGQRTAASPPCSLPKVLPVPASMVPETHVLLGPYSLAGAKLTVFGGITAGLDDTVAGSAPRSLKITLPRNTNSSLFVGNIGRVSVLSGINVVVRCSDWTNVQGLGVSLYEDAAPTPSSPRHAAYPIYYASGAVQDRYGASYAPWAANTWRVMRIPATYFQPTNNPTEWGDTDAHASKSMRGISFWFKTGSKECAVWIDRAFDEVWPKAFFGMTLDGFYSGAQSAIYQPFVDHRWRGTARLYRVTGTAPYPAWGQVQNALDMGWDVGLHMRQANSEPFTTRSTAADITAGYQALVADAREHLMGDLSGGVFVTFSQNGGFSQGGDTAGALRQNGVVASRSRVSDATFGVDVTRPTAYTLPSWLYCSDGWIPALGQYNYAGAVDWAGLHTSGDRDNFDALWRGFFEKCRRWHLAVLPYVHNVVPNPGPMDIGPTMAHDLIQYLESHRGDFVFGAPIDLWRMTYGRQGPTHVDAYGSWQPAPQQRNREPG